MPLTLGQLAEKWKDAPPGERAQLQSYIIELCQALGVEPPGLKGSGYEFELAITVTERTGTDASNFIDCWKAGHFALEGKHVQAAESDDIRLRRAFGQVKGYANGVPERPPYIMVLDVGRTLLLWDRWSGDYGGFGVYKRIDLTRLGENAQDVALLKTIWTDPASLDPRARAAKVTREIAARLALLAASLEARGHGQEEVARFLIRVVFTMFAEDVDLLPQETFRDLVSDNSAEDLPEALEDLWKTMDKGGRFGGRKIVRFNGHFFRDAKALPLKKADCDVLTLAALADWQDVEPSIFGTLLVRALDPVERHRLGAEFTPREYVERLVRPTVEEPIRERWTAVQAEALELRETKREKDRKAALNAVVGFHEWLCGLQFLDPACGSGNFLYVTLNIVKRIELEVIQLENDLRKAGDADLRLFEVHPRQFHGIEIKHWAREIAELTLWIGYHQFWREHRHVEFQPPILEDTGTIECRDAVLAWDEIRHDPSRDRPDPTPRITHPVTGELVPDPKAKLEYMEYVNPRPAEWPKADFIVGNPPYIGTKRMRDSFGNGYVESLRSAYQDVPDAADYVMYWWYKAAREVATGNCTRAGLITTNTIIQSQNRQLLSDLAVSGARVAWAIADHPWVDESGAADVRVAMTVVAFRPRAAMLVRVSETGEIVGSVTKAVLNADLTAHADVSSASRVALLSNEGVSSFGFMINGSGFILESQEAHELLKSNPKHVQIIRPYLNGRDLASRPRDVSLVDFGLLTEEEARQWPILFDIIRSRVKPHRDTKSDSSSRKFWWRFARNREDLRHALVGLKRYVITIETAKHRFFVFSSVDVAPDHKLIAFATDDAAILGVLSARPHVTWATAAGGRLGVGNDPVYNKSLCFDAFAFPHMNPALRARIARTAEVLDAHRKAALDRDERVTMTGMYNVVEKLRSGEALTKKEREVHEIAACGVLRDLHDELDALVAEAYGWPWPLTKDEILERLVALHDERVEEEKAGKVRWLRPDYQIPRFGKDLPGGGELALESKSGGGTAPKVTESLPWPPTASEQIAAVKSVLDQVPRLPAEVASRFKGAKADLVSKHLDFLALLGEARRAGEKGYLAG